MARMHIQRLRPRDSSDASEETDRDLEWLALRGIRRFRLRSLDREDTESEPEEDPDSDSDEEPDEESESESEEDEDEGDDDDRRALFFDGPSPLSLISFSRSFSLFSRILFAVPLLFLNSSGTSTDGFPSALSFANSLGFSNCCVRDGRET